MMRQVRLALVGTQGQAVRAEAPVQAGAVEARPAKVVAVESAGGQGNAGTTGSAGMDGGAGGRGGAGGNDGSCSSNSDCQGVQVCYVGVNSCGTSVGGHCVTRLPDGCSGCACLDIVSGSCPTGQGGRCFESGVAGGCWYCAVPI